MPYRPGRGVLWLAGVAALVGLLVVLAIGRAWADVQRETTSLAMTTSPSGGSAFAIPDLRTLTRMSDVVVVGRVVKDGTTRLLIQPAQTPIPFQPVAPPSGISEEKAAGLPAQPPPPRAVPAGAAQTNPTGPKIPITEYSIDIERVARGSAAAGQQITVLQTGGIVGAPVFPGGPSVSRTLQVEGDTLMRAGERYILFLQRTPDGAFAIVGGPQGRLTVDSAARVHPLPPGNPATGGRDGQTLDAFVADVTAI